MSVYLVSYFILLLCLIQAATSQEADEFGCNETCGNVIIRSPFGIKTGCYTNSWFRVTCNETANGPKPFISLINLELLQLVLSIGAVSVNNPITYLNCGNEGINNTSPVSINLKDSPFFFSSRWNLLGSVGCGNLASISPNIQTGPTACCLQQKCDELSSEGTCFSRIPENLTSYAVKVTEISPRKENSKRCMSAFLFGIHNGMDLSSEIFSQISSETTHVPATLEWNPNECDLQGSSCSFRKVSKCIEKCGNVDIPYPFGIQSDCYMNDGFRVTCKATDDGQKPFISSINLQLHSVSVSNGTILIDHPVTYFKCRTKDNNGISVNLTGSPFFYSVSDNAFWSSGCGNLATVFRNQADTYPTCACLQPDCRNTENSSNAGCLMRVPTRLSSFVAKMTDIDSSDGCNGSCGSAFVISSNYFNENLTIIPDHHEISNWTYVNTTLQWGVRQRGLCELQEGSAIFCSSQVQYCWSNMGSTHLCVCSVSYNSGDNYLTDVCEEIGKCRSRYYKYCYMLCLNTPGNNCSSKPCPDKYKYASAENWCVPDNSSMFLRHLAIIIGCSTSIGTIFVLLGTWSMYHVLKRRKNTKLKQRYFEKNGGLLLQQQLSSNEGNVEKIRVFTSKELEMATDNYNKNRILGEGGQGTVYKGMLSDGSIVAIKKSKMVEEKNIDEMEIEQFINEVTILSQINHRNVVKLLGCCLETEFPLLVYEFIPNGTLSQLIHEQNEEFPMTWEMLLRIAVEIANALSYLHSAASVPIYHRDIKSSNILLDDKYRAKVSDFGISRSVALEKTHITTRIQGTFGYLDPEYFRSSQFTEKSDVYSFGVVLVELLTGQKPISSRQSEDEVMRGLVTFFLSKMKENSLLDILDPMVVNDGPEEEIIEVAKLAKRCLNLNGKKRPTMKEVAMELQRIKACEEASAIQQSMDEDSYMGDVIEPLDIASGSTSGSLINDSVALSLDASSLVVSNTC